MATGPIWWALRGAATIFSLLDTKLKPTFGFKSLTASQRKGDAFLLGEALTHWFAQAHLGTSVVTPLEHHSGTLTATAKGAPYPKQMPKYFRHSVMAGAKSEPDFLAFSEVAQVHVLESKGRASFGPSGLPQAEINKARNKALRQVCRIHKVNGLTPTTRTACVFGFHNGGLLGQITDPPEVERMEYRVEFPLLIKQAYAAVLDPMFEAYQRPIADGYVGFEFMPGWKFGIKEEVYGHVRRIQSDRDVIAFLAFLRILRESASGLDESVSIGPDGFYLSGNSEFEAKRQKAVAPFW